MESSKIPNLTNSFELFVKIFAIAPFFAFFFAFIYESAFFWTLGTSISVFFDVTDFLRSSLFFVAPIVPAIILAYLVWQDLLTKLISRLEKSGEPTKPEQTNKLSIGLVVLVLVAAVLLFSMPLLYYFTRNPLFLLEFYFSVAVSTVLVCVYVILFLYQVSNVYRLAFISIYFAASFVLGLGLLNAVIFLNGSSDELVTVQLTNGDSLKGLQFVRNLNQGIILLSSENEIQFLYHSEIDSFSLNGRDLPKFLQDITRKNFSTLDG